MSETKHTPGPWSAKEYGWISTVGDPYGHGPMHVADVRGWGHLTGAGTCNYNEARALDIQGANAWLIAAAPLLLEACEALLAEADTRGGCTCAYGDSDKCVACRARDAIAKAKGGAR